MYLFQLVRKSNQHQSRESLIVGRHASELSGVVKGAAKNQLFNENEKRATSL